MHAIGRLQGLEHRSNGMAVLRRNHQRCQQFVTLVPIVGQIDAVFLVPMLAKMQLTPVVNEENVLWSLRL